MKRAHHEIEGTTTRPTSSPSAGSHVTPTESGPSKIPKISRKVHACTECQGRKIKCDLSTGKSVCARCERKGLKCIVNKSLQSLLEDETGWKATMDQTSGLLQAAVSEILRTLNLPNLESFSPDRASSSMSHNMSENIPTSGVRFNMPDHTSPTNTIDERRKNQPAGMAMTRENSQEAEDSPELGHALSAPMGTLFEVTKLRNLRSHPHGNTRHTLNTTSLEEDFISSGKITEKEANELFINFSRSLNHYLWGGIALVHTDLTSVRRSSSLLLAAILAVTALHVPGKEEIFDICYAEFLALVCDSMLDRYHSLDGVRGLCIGAFWLSDVSWKLSGHAVRIATELNLHQSYAKAMRGSREHIDGARVWYFLYVCDHHFSIAYGRPPVIHEDIAIVAHEKFLQLPGISQADLRLHSQVSIFIILTEMYNNFGPDIEQSLTEDDWNRLRYFNASLDNWRITWETKLAPNIYISAYPAKGVGLHHQFGKLQLNSLALRGLQNTPSQTLSTERREFANMAISSAMTILRLVNEEPDIKAALVGVPLYLHTMVTFAAVFLLKVQQKWQSAGLGIDSAHLKELVGQVIKLLNESKAGNRHLSYHIASGLSRMLDRFAVWEHHQATVLSVNPANGSHTQVTNTSYGAGASGQTAYDTNTEFVPFGMYGEAMPLYDEHYFPVGFFDVLSTQMAE